MPLRHDPILTEALAARIEARWGGRRVLGLVLDPERRRAALRLRDSPALVFLLHPEDGGYLLPRTRLFTAPEFEFRSLQLLEASSPPDERLLRIDVGPAPGRPRFRIAAELHTNQWNLLLLRLPEGEIERVLWARRPGDRVLEEGAEYTPLSGDREGRDGPVSADRWRTLLEAAGPDERRTTALRNVAWLSSVNVDWVLGAGAVGASYERYRELWTARRSAADPDAGEARVLDRPWGPQPYPHTLGQEEAPRADDLLEAMTAAARREGILDGLDTDEAAIREADAEPPEPELVELVSALRDRIRELESRRGSLRRELEEGPDPGELRTVGSLILSRKDAISKGDELVRLEGFEGGEREVELDPRLAPSENADRYFERARRRERAASRLPGKIAAAERRLERVRDALGRVEEAVEGGQRELPDDTVDELWALAGGRRDGEAGGREEGERKPYRVLETSGGIEVRVGKSAKANEDLTFHHSHTEDIWLHARQVAGSHVILRWGRKDANPPREDLLEAAIAAAVNSKARHSGSVAVDWTRRKYVRSPRKSPPGAVIPQQHETVFVRPDEKIVERMQARAREPEGAAGG